MKEQMRPRFVSVLAVEPNHSLLIGSDLIHFIFFMQNMMILELGFIILRVEFKKTATFRCWGKCLVQIIWNKAEKSFKFDVLGNLFLEAFVFLRFPIERMKIFDSHGNLVGKDDWCIYKYGTHTNTGIKTFWTSKLILFLFFSFCEKNNTPSHITINEILYEIHTILK